MRAKPTSEYIAWGNMVQRCTNPKNPNFHNYGGRGIRVCDRWLTFSHFLADMGPRPSTKHTLDREDNDGEYCPGNCRWATQREQCRNMRKNSRLTHAGETLTVTQWAERTGLDRNTIDGRIDGGWSVEAVLTTPAKERRPKPFGPPQLLNKNKTHCPHGHPLDGVFKKGPRAGNRFCKTCHREKALEYHRRKAAQI